MKDTIKNVCKVDMGQRKLCNWMTVKIGWLKIEILYRFIK